MTNDGAKKQWVLLIFLILVLAFAFQGSRGLWRPDEGRYVRCAYEMLKTNEWITPQLNYTPHLTKPPLTYWLIASGLKLVGMNEWGARFFHAIAFAITAVVVACIGARMWGERQGIAAGFIYATTVTPFIAANIVTTDTILTCFETLAVAAFWLSIMERERPQRRLLWTLAMWGFLGLAFLTKGPAGLIPLVVIILFIILARDVQRPSLLFTLAGIVVFAGVALPWYVIIINRHDGLLSYFFFHEFIGRVLSGEQNRNPDWFGPIKEYLPVLTAGALPWSAFLPLLLKRARPALSRGSWWNGLRSRPKALFLGLWFFASLFVLTLSSSRLSLYVLPLFAPLALFTAHELTRIFPEMTAKAFQLKRTPALVLGLIVLILLSIRFVTSHITNGRDTRAFWNGIRPTIEKNVGNEPYEIVSVHSNYDGLEFYSGRSVECLRSGEGPAAFIPPESISDEYDELSTVKYEHVFLGSQKYKNEIASELSARGIQYSIADAPFGRVLFFCKGTSNDQSVTYLAIAGDTGTATASQTLLGCTLYHIDQRLSLDGILLTGDNLMGWNGTGKIENAYKKYFEKPYWPLLNNGVRFYAALGNHDWKHAYSEVNYPLFHMNGRRYYSQVFGPNRVEAFFLDSNTIEIEPSQVDWLEKSLQKSSAKWKIAVMHHPIYSSAKKQRTSQPMVKLLEPIFIRNNVDLAVYGHNHVYERLRPINGIQYMTVGSSGKVDRNGLSASAPERAYGNDKVNIVLLLQFRDDTGSFTAYTANENVVDEGQITHASVLRSGNAWEAEQRQKISDDCSSGK